MKGFTFLILCCVLAAFRAQAFVLEGHKAPHVTYENALNDSEDVTTDEWYRYYYTGTEVTDNGDGSQTYAQSTASTWYFKQHFGDNVCSAGLDNYVFRGEFAVSPDELVFVKMFNGDDGSGILAQPSLTKYQHDEIDWMKTTIPFTMSDIEVRNTYMLVAGPSTISTVMWRKLQIAKNPGKTLYSTGDSITAFSLNPDITVDGTTNYTSIYEYDHHIVADNAGVSSAPLADIYARMQTDLASTTYPVIFIEGGINDIVQFSVPLETMKTTMTDMINYAKTKADLVVVFGLPPTNSEVVEEKEQMVAYDAWLEPKAAELGVQFFSMNDVLGDGHGDWGFGMNPLYYIGDNIHPTPLGHMALANALSAQVALPSSAKLINRYIKTDPTCVGGP